MVTIAIHSSGAHACHPDPPQHRALGIAASDDDDDMPILGKLNIRPAQSGDLEAIWSILEPVIRAGDTYTLPRSLSRDAALSYWLSNEHEVFVAEDGGMVLGTYYLRA